MKDKAESFNLKELIRIDTDLNDTSLGASGVTHFAFAQRKYVGFRCKYEYDVKVLLIATEKNFCVVTYKLNASYEHVVIALCKLYNALWTIRECHEE